MVSIGMHSKYHMTVDAFFQLQEYKEFQQALQSSAEAKKDARNAIYISAGLAVFQIVLTIIQFTFG
jgi:hypothetical protein